MQTARLPLTLLSITLAFAILETKIFCRTEVGFWDEQVGMRDLSRASEGRAPGSPGIAPTWTSSAKDMVGCALGPSRVWFTLGFGIVNEVYYPRLDIPQIRDLGFIVADGCGFWVEVKRLQNYTLRLLAPGTPAVEIAHMHERFTLTLRVTPDPARCISD